MEDFKIEICSYSYSSGLAAQKGGAKRIELCANMAEGGTTPSYGQIKICVERLYLEVWPIIRPRGGDFLYSDDEFQIMLEDIKLCKELGCAGVVTGILNADGLLDVERNRMLIEAAAPLPVSLHRAFDMTKSLSESLETAIGLGFVRILTSGGKQNALDGAEVISELIVQANNRIQLMPGAGVNPQNIKKIAKLTKAKDFHSSAKTVVESRMIFRNQGSNMGTEEDDFIHYESDLDIVRDMVSALQ